MWHKWITLLLLVWWLLHPGINVINTWGIIFLIKKCLSFYRFK